MEPAPYRKAVRLIKERAGALVMPTLGMDTLAPTERLRNLIEMRSAGDVMPELVPIDVITCNMDLYDSATKTFTDFSQGGEGNELYQNTPATWRIMATQIAELGLKPVPILWDIGSIRNTAALVDMNLLRPPLFCELSLTEGGFLSGHPGTQQGLKAYLDFFPTGQNWLWTVLLWGGSLLPLAEHVIRLGGHISIGLGDYGYKELGWPSNAKLVERVKDIADNVGRPVATPAEARTLLGIR